MRLISLLPISLLLAACGGTTTPITIASSGYAKAGQTIDDAGTFTLRDIDATSLTPTSSALRQADIIIGSPKDDDSIDVTIDGVVYNLGLLNDGSYEGQIGDEGAQIGTVLDLSPVAQSKILTWGNEETEEFFISNFVVGLETDPDTFLQQSDTATFTGGVLLTLTQRDEFGVTGGVITLDVDFSDATVAGAFEIEVALQDEFPIALPATNYTLTETAITATGFSGDIAQKTGATGEILQDAQYTGTFFGAEGETAGGTITASINDPNDTQDILANGAFIVNKDDE